MTIGQAVDQAVKMHEEVYKESKVYGAYVSQKGQLFDVEIYATHFSVALQYLVAPPVAAVCEK